MFLWICRVHEAAGRIKLLLLHYINSHFFGKPNLTYITTQTYYHCPSPPLPSLPNTMELRPGLSAIVTGGANGIGKPVLSIFFNLFCACFFWILQLYCNLIVVYLLCMLSNCRLINTIYS